jgi:hypothetical protein
MTLLAPLLTPPALLAWLPLAAGGDLWYAAPLIVAVSFVYSATRYERWDLILAGAIRTATWIAGFMFAIFLLLWLVSLWL